MIVAIILNKFDCFIVIEGGTGIGKSSFAWEVAFAVSKEFRRLFSLNENTITYYYERIGKEQGLTPEEFVAKILELKQKKAYHFNPYRDLVYSQDAMQEFLASWNRIAIPDELINVLFNREFFSQKQKDIVKMVNMYRDHENIILSCVPMFSSLDNQIRNLTKIKIIIKKRGLAMVHLPNKTIYSKDKWDSLVNEKIERVWIMKKIQNPNYSKLTTFRGFLKFHPMSQAHAKIYQDIKNKKRSTILKEEMGIDIKDSKDVIELLVDRLLKGGIKNMQMIEGVAFANGLGLDQLRGKIRKILVEREVNPTISHYFYDKRAKNEADDNSISITRT
jgi:hypothetical protein